MRGLQAVKLQFVVSDQAICKHEGALLWSWEKERRQNEKQKESGEGLWDDRVLIWGMVKISLNINLMRNTETRGNSTGGNKGPVKTLIHALGE